MEKDMIPNGLKWQADRIRITAYTGDAATLSIPECIGEFAFAGCTGITSVTLSRRTEVGEDAFPAGARLTYYD